MCFYQLFGHLYCPKANLTRITMSFLLKVLIPILGIYLHDSSCSSSDILEQYIEVFHLSDMEQLCLELIQSVLHGTNCFATVLDDFYHQVIGNVFIKLQKIKPHFKILVNDSEDLLSPNYNTVKVIQEVKKNNCNLYIILLANSEQMARVLLFGDRHRTIDPRAKFVLLHDRRLFMPSYNVLWRKIVNVLFIRRYKNRSRFELSTVPFPPPLNSPIIPYKINSWYTKGFEKNKALFEDKTSDLQGQTLKVVTFEHMPTTVITAIDNSTEKLIPTYGGLEIEVLKTLSRAMNFQSSIYEPENADVEQWGHKQINGSFSGLLGEMISGNADIALGTLYYTPYHLQMMDLSIPYNTECLTFLTPESLTDNSWQTLILPFQTNMWIAVLITLFLGGFLFYFLALYHRHIEFEDFAKSSVHSLEAADNETGDKLTRLMKTKTQPLKDYAKAKWKKWNRKNEFLKKHNIAYAQKMRFLHCRYSQVFSTISFNSISDRSVSPPIGLYIFEELNNSILYTYGMFMSVSLPKVPTGWTIRMFTGWWWLYCILVAVSYRASMTAILASPAPRVTIDTLEELAQSEIGCGGWGEQSREFFVTSLDVASQKVGRRFEVSSDVDAAVERVASGEFAYYDNVDFLHFLTVKYKDTGIRRKFNETEEDTVDKTKGKILHIMSDCVINMPVSIGLQKNSPLKPKIDIYLGKVVEAGLVKKWLNDVMFKIRTTEARSSKAEIKALMNLSKLYGAVAALLVGYVVSFVVLLIEIIKWHLVEMRDPLFDRYDMRRYYENKRTRKQRF